MKKCHGGLLENLVFNALEYDLVIALAITSQKEDSRIRLAEKRTCDDDEFVPCGARRNRLWEGITSRGISNQKGGGKWFYTNGNCRRTKGSQATCLEQAQLKTSLNGIYNCMTEIMYRPGVSLGTEKTDTSQAESIH